MKLFDIMATSFENFDNTVRNYLSKTFNSIGYQYTHNQLFGIIFDGVKGVIQNAMFYIEDALTEQNVFMASRKKSIYSLAKISGYDPYYGSAAVGTLIGRLKINNGLSSKSTKLFINNYTRVYNKNTGITYTLFLNSNRYCIDVTSPLVNYEFKVIQGEWKTYQYGCKGEALEKISVDSSGLFDKDYIEVTVNGERWTPVSSLYDMSTDAKEFILTTGYENVFDIMFGNGIYGKIPNNGDTVEIKYLAHSGTVGNISALDTPEFLFLDKGYDSLGNTEDLNKYLILEVNNVLSGGTNSDSIDFVRNMIGYNSRSNVLASEDNFKLFFNRFSFVSHVNCWSEENTMEITVTCLSNNIDNIVDYNDFYKLTDKQLVLTNVQKDMIVNTLENSNKSFAGLTLKFKDPIIRRYAIFCYIKPKSIYSKNIIEENVKEAFATYFMNLDNDTDFIPKSDLIQLGVNCNEDIVSFDIDIISKLAEETYKNGYYLKNQLQFINGEYKYIQKKVYYEKGTYPGLDNFGNIKLESKLEIPFLGGGFNYYTDKESNNKTSFVKLEAIQIIWI